MAELAAIVNSERLIDINYEKDKLKGLFTEILHILQKQQIQIKKIEEKMPDYAEVSELQELEKQVNVIHDTFKANINNHENKLKEINENIPKLDEELRNYIDNGLLQCTNEAKRMMAAELSAFRTTPQLSKQNSVALIQPVPDTTEFRVNDIEAAVNDLKVVTTNLQSKMDLVLEFDPNVHDIKLTTLENDIKIIQKQLETYPTVQVDVSNLSLQVPAQISKLDMKLARLSEQVGKALNNQEILQMASRVVTESQDIKALTPQMSAKVVPVDQIPVPNNAVKLEVLKQNDLVELPDIDQIPMPKAKVPADLPADLPPIPYVSDSNKQSGRTRVETIVSQVSTSAKNSRPGSSQDQKEVVQIIENRTYTTELTSSMRVVTEIEWAKQMIATHHEAIKQIQASARTQHDNLETMNENVIRVNNTINSRISQLAQQSLNQRQEVEELRKLVFEQLSKVRKDISAVQTSRNADLLLAQNIPLQSTSNTGSAKTSSRSFRKFELLPPLPLPSSAASSSEQTPTKQPSPPPLPPTIPAIQEVASEEKPKPEPEKVRKKNRKQNFLIVDIYDDSLPPPPQQQFKVPEQVRPVQREDSNSYYRVKPKPEDIKTSSRSNNSTNLPPPEEPQQQMKIIQQEEYIPPEPEKKETTITKTIILKLGNYKRPRSAGMDKTRYEQSKNDTFGDADLENRIKSIARRVVEAMVNMVKDQLQEQIKVVQQNSSNLMILLDKKVDREFVETMFNKFRVMMGTFNDQIENMQASFLNWVTRDELEIVLQKFAQTILDEGPASAAVSKYSCLICGHAQHSAAMHQTAMHTTAAQTAATKKRAATTLAK